MNDIEKRRVRGIEKRLPQLLERKKLVLALEGKYKEFLVEIRQAYEQSSSHDFSDFSRSTGISTSNISNLLNTSNRVVLSEEPLRKAQKIIETGSLVDDLLMFSSDLPPVLKGLVQYSHESIETIFDLNIRFIELGSYESFVTVFGKHEDLITECLKFSGDAAESLSDQTTLLEIQKVLYANSFESKIEKALVRYQKAIQKQIDEIQKNVDILRPHYELQRDLEQDLGFSRGFLVKVLSGKATENAVANMLTETDKLVIRHSKKESKKTRTKPVQGSDTFNEYHPLVMKLIDHFGSKVKTADAMDVKDRHLNRSLHVGGVSESLLLQLLFQARKTAIEHGIVEIQSKPLDVEVASTTETKPACSKDTIVSYDNAGATSPLGVRFTLGRSSFKNLKGKPSEEEIEEMKKLIESTRAVLNVCTQVEDDFARSDIREKLGDEVDALLLTIRAFSEMYPINISELLEAQQITWANVRERSKE